MYSEFNLYDIQHVRDIKQVMMIEHVKYGQVYNNTNMSLLSTN
jgi:hypothetical protein